MKNGRCSVQDTKEPYCGAYFKLVRQDKTLTEILSEGFKTLGLKNKL